MSNKTKKFFGIYLPLGLSLILIVFAGFFFQEPQKAEAGWYSTGGTWSYRKQITIDKSKVGAGTTTPLTNFPMVFSVTDADLKFTGSGGKVASSTGLDILFTSADGTTKLDYEMESYSSTTGQVVAWVEIPSLSTTADTIIYIYFGNASASDQSNRTGVWDADFRIVHHVSETSGTSISDSTSNGLSGTKNSSSQPSATSTGKIGGAQSYVSANSADQITTTDTTDPTAYTLSTWVKPSVVTAQNIFVRTDASGPTSSWSHQLMITSGSKFQTYIYDGVTKGVIGDTTLVAGNWYFVTAVVQNNGSMSLYVNGVSEGTPVSINTLWTGGDRWKMGSNAGNGGWFDGIIDELKYSTAIRSVDWIKTEYNNQSSPNTFYSYGTAGIQNRASDTASVATKNQPGSTPGWYSTGGTWTYRKQITIDRNKVATTTSLTSFPMLFSVTDADLKFTGSGGKIASSTGGDIVFTSSDGTTKLSHEIEKYVSTTGETLVWVKIPTLSATSDTIIYVYFGNSSATNQQDPTNVWDSNYKAVYHLKDGTTLNLTDSTSSAKNGTNNAGVTAGVGQIDGSASFNNALYQYVSLPSSTFGSGSVTVELWTKFTTFTGYWPMFSAYTGDSDSMEIFIDNTNRLFGGNYNNRALSNSDLVTGQWYYVVLTAVSGGATQFYINGVASGSTGTTNFSTYTVAPNIGRRLSYYYNNLIDEVRISSGVARGSDWIKTQYNNQSSPGTFFSYGALQTSTRVNSSGVSVPTVKTRGGVKFR